MRDAGDWYPTRHRHESSRRTHSFVLEATLLGFLATLLGVSLSAPIALGLDNVIDIPVVAIRNILMSDISFRIAPSQLLMTILGFTLFCALSSILPALRAARLPRLPRFR